MAKVTRDQDDKQMVDDSSKRGKDDSEDDGSKRGKDDNANI